jgi:hypothetical protein
MTRRELGSTRIIRADLQRDMDTDDKRFFTQIEIVTNSKVDLQRICDILSVWLNEKNQK